MRSTFVRAVGVTVVLAATVLSTVPPAPATTVRNATVAGRMILAAPLGYPCTGNKTTPGTAKCPPTAPTTHDDLPLPGDPVPNFHPHYGGNTIPIVAVDDDACLDTGTNVGKAPKPPAHEGACTFTLLASSKNHINGYCDMNGGQMLWTFTDALGQAWTLDIHFTGTPPGTLHLTGHARKISTGRTGKIKGELAIAAVPDALPTPTVTPPHVRNNSCDNKTARVLTFVGDIEWEVLTFI